MRRLNVLAVLTILTMVSVGCFNGDSKVVATDSSEELETVNGLLENLEGLSIQEQLARITRAAELLEYPSKPDGLIRAGQCIPPLILASNASHHTLAFNNDECTEELSTEDNGALCDVRHRFNEVGPTTTEYYIYEDLFDSAPSGCASVTFTAQHIVDVAQSVLSAIANSRVISCSNDTSTSGVHFNYIVVYDDANGDERRFNSIEYEILNP